MCCKNEYSICKCVVFFVSLILGIAAGLVIGLVSAVLPFVPLVFSIIAGVSALLLIGGILLLIYTSGTSSSQSVTRCFCPLSKIIIPASAIGGFLSVVVTVVALFTGNVIASAILGALAVFFFVAALIGYLCFVYCLINNQNCLL